jgi:type III restriction enzyme
MDAIECGIVKLPRVPVADNIAQDVPRYRELWKNIKSKMPKKGRGKGGSKDPESLPTELKTAIEALYGHYEETFEEWKKAGFNVPPCFIIVCNNTSTSKLVYDYVSGYLIDNERGDKVPRRGACPLFSNYDENGNAHSRPYTLLIDSEQLESGEALDTNFREMAGPEIEQFRREIIQREGAGGADTKHQRCRPLEGSDEHGGEAGQARGRHPLRRIGGDAHGRLGREYGHPCVGRAGFRYPAVV